MKIYMLYRPPSDSNGNFSCEKADLLSSDKLRTMNCIVLGHLNINFSESSSEVHSFSNLTQSHYFVSMMDKSTRSPTFENRIPTLLDHICTNKLSVLDSWILVDFTDHCPVYCRIPVKRETPLVDQ